MINFPTINEILRHHPFDSTCNEQQLNRDRLEMPNKCLCTAHVSMRLRIRLKMSCYLNLHSHIFAS